MNRMASVLAALRAMLYGSPVPPLSGGARNIAPGPAPVAEGNYAFIQSWAFTNANAEAILPIPPAFINWGQLPVPVEGLGGTFGGPASGTAQVAIPSPPTMYFDPASGLYVNLEPTQSGT